jgi:S-adenosylmethionine:tRNA ribosyltransferase-isomerase
MKKQELQFQFAESLIAIEPAPVSRVFSAIQGQGTQPEEFKEIAFAELLAKFTAGDILLLNDTKVLPRRVFSIASERSIDPKEFVNLSKATNIYLDCNPSEATIEHSVSTSEYSEATNEQSETIIEHSGGANNANLEILFLASDDKIHWQVLFPAKKIKLGSKIFLPGGVAMELIEKGLPQKVKCTQPLTEEYFEQHGDVPIPPYIQKARNERKAKSQDKNWYQTHWAAHGGSFAAPTASLHFKPEHLAELRQKNVAIEKITLHVGMGTFLPVHVEDLNDHQMHKEEVFIATEVWQKIQKVREQGGKVWALGTTVTRALESVLQNKFTQTEQGYSGATDLLIQPGFRFQVVDYLLTNFHQPESTLLALVFAFAGKEKVKAGYALAIEKKFRLFSYGELSRWTRA